MKNFANISLKGFAGISIIVFCYAIFKAEINFAGHDRSLIYAKYLHVNVSPSAAIEFQHFQNKIIEKINSYFGYKAISGIKIRQKFMQNNLMKEKNSANDIHKNVKKLNHNLENINDKELKQSIVNLGLSITNKNF